MFTDFVMNGQASGEFASALQGVRYDPGLLRPYIDRDGKKYCTVNTGRTVYNPKTGKDEATYAKVAIKDLMAQDVQSPVFNATSMRKESWIELDRVVLKAARLRLRAWSDLMAANSFGGFDGMSKLVLEHETMSDPGEAVVDMDGLTDGRNDAPRFQLQGLPLPITHSDFWFSRRKLAVSQSSGTPLDTTMAEAAGRRVAELVERTLIGVNAGLTYGGNSSQVGGYGRNSSVYGYTNFPNRLTYTSLATPTGSNPDATVGNVLNMRELLYANRFYGPFMIYTSSDWDLYLDNDYARLGGNNASMTLRQRLEGIDGIQGIKRLDFLTNATNPFTMIMVQMTPDVARAVNGMNMTTVQWESQGGMRLNFKVMAIWVPQIRADFNGNAGILQASTF